MRKQLRMIYDSTCPPLDDIRVPEGFCIRPLREDEWEKYFKLRVDCGFDLWNENTIKDFYAHHAIPDGIIVVEDCSNGELVASATAEYGELEDSDVPATLGWVMTREEYGGRGLGRAVSAYATKMLMDAGLKPVYLLTDDTRKPAVFLYLKMRWKPWLFQEDMPGRWQALCKEFNYPENYLDEWSVKTI